MLTTLAAEAETPVAGPSLDLKIRTQHAEKVVRHSPMPVVVVRDAADGLSWRWRQTLSNGSTSNAEENGDCELHGESERLFSVNSTDFAGPSRMKNLQSTQVLEESYNLEESSSSQDMQPKTCSWVALFGMDLPPHLHHVGIPLVTTWVYHRHLFCILFT